MRAAAETLYIGRIGRGGAGLLGVGPGFLIRRLTGHFFERNDALPCLRHVRAGAVVLQICRISCDGAGLLGVRPGLLVGLLARLLIGRLLLRRGLMRIRGLAASRRESSPGNDGNDRQFRKWDASSVPELLTPMTAHARCQADASRGNEGASSRADVGPGLAANHEAQPPLYL